MKIALIVKNLNIKGGTQRQALCLARELKRLGHDIKAYTFSFDREKCYSDLMAEIEIISLPPEKLNKKSYLPQIRKLRETVYENKISRELARLIDKDTEVLNPHDQVSYKAAYYFKKETKNIPAVWMMNDLPLSRFIYDRERICRPDFKKPLLNVMSYYLKDWYENKKFLSRQDKIVVLDNWNKGLVKKYLGREAEVVRSGLDIEKFSYRAKAMSGRVNLLMAGIFFPHRRFEDAVEAVKILREEGRDVNLAIVGSGELDKKYYEKIVKLTADLKLNDCVSFLGRVSDEELVRLYQEKDIFIFSNYPQTWGLAVFEAMAAGTPVIISRGAGAHEVLTDKENALIVEEKQPAQIAQAVKELADSPELYQKLNQQGRQFAEENITWRQYALKMLKIFEQETDK